MISSSVVICVYTDERWELMTSSIDAASEQLDFEISELIVVVDHNKDLLSKLRDRYSSLAIVENENSVGLSGARNTGTRVAQGEVVIFLDDDAVPRAEWLSRLLEPFSKPKVVGVGGWVEADWELGRMPRWWPTTFLWVVGCSYLGLPASGSRIRNPIGASMALRRQPILEVGGFSPEIGRLGKLPLGCEETELCIRIARSFPDTVIVHVAESVVNHRVPKARCTPRYFVKRCWSEGKSKALVGEMVGTTAALESERRYILHSIPLAITNAIGREGFGAVPSVVATIVGGLGTVAGYLYERVAIERRGLSRAP